jgi:GDP-L-fucose synthase
MLRRFHDAVIDELDDVVIWGSGDQRRQLLHVDDLARACELLLRLEHPPGHVNVAPVGDTSIRELASLSARIVGYRGRIQFDTSRPEGVKRRELDPRKIQDLGWIPSIDLESGLRRTWDSMRVGLGDRPTSERSFE